MREAFSLDLSSGRTLHGVVHPANRPGPRPTVVICHGFKGFMDWGFFPHLADLLADRGLTAIRFNFTGSGMQPGDELVTDVEAFRTARFSQDLDELTELLAAVGERVAVGRVDGDRIGLLGHSRGGGTSILAAAADPWRDRLAALVTWAAVSTFDRLPAAEKERYRQAGGMPIVNARTGQELAIGVEVLDDLEVQGERLVPAVAAGRVRTPWLIVHGDGDETVPVAEARRLQVAAGGAVLEVVEGAGHTFGAEHPFRGPTPHLISALNATQTWFRRHLAVSDPA